MSHFLERLTYLSRRREPFADEVILGRVPPLCFFLHNRDNDTARLCDATTAVARIELL